MSKDHLWKLRSTLRQKTSMTEQKYIQGTAFVTMVAIDKYGKATAVPPLILDSDDDKTRFREGENRMKSRLEGHKSEHKT